jgi:hypothetical protein
MNNQLIFLPVDAEKNSGNCSLRLLQLLLGWKYLIELGRFSKFKNYLNRDSLLSQIPSQCCKSDSIPAAETRQPQAFACPPPVGSSDIAKRDKSYRSCPFSRKEFA